MSLFREQVPVPDLPCRKGTATISILSPFWKRPVYAWKWWQSPVRLTTPDFFTVHCFCAPAPFPLQSVRL